MTTQRALAVAILVLAAPLPALAANPTVPGVASAPYPTLRNLSLEWLIDGDDDADGIVTVRYRPQGAASWLDAMPLRRVPAGANEGFSWVNRHAGSILDLQPATTYEIELTLQDPDGGSATQTLTATTRPVPAAAPNGNPRPVTPQTFSTVASAAQAGDVLVLAPGSYPGFTFARNGTATAPIVIRSQEPLAAAINGAVRLDNRSYVFLEGLTVNGTIRLDDSTGTVVRGCAVNTSASGIVAYGGITNGYIADNRVIGSTTFSNATVGANGANIGEGIEVTGPGTVIEHNYVKGFRDCISTLEDSEAVNQVSIDILDNDIEVGADDAIEADFTMGNCRVMRNRITNSFVGLSAQPTLGGPIYFVRNVMFNIIYSPFKLHRGSVGDVALHNTSVKCGDALGIYAGVTWSRALFRNNLFIGGQGGGTYGGYGNGSGQVARLADADPTCHFDYDGFGSIGTGTFQGRIGAATFSSLAQLRSNTTEAHAEQVDMNVFAATVEFPSSGPFPERPVPSLELAAGSAAVDRGVALANVNAGYGGTAPDLGAYELGQPPPSYGPRSGTVAPPDAGTTLPDAGTVVTPPDAGSVVTPPDAGAQADAGPRADAGGGAADAAAAGADAGAVVAPDAGSANPGLDSGVVGRPDAGSNSAAPDAAAPEAPVAPTASGVCGCSSAGASPFSAVFLIALVALSRRRAA